MWWDAVGAHLLGGQAGAGVYLDGVQIAPYAGGWGWTALNQIQGQAWPPGVPQGFFTYTFGDPYPSGLKPRTDLVPPYNLSTQFFGAGFGPWVAYLQSRTNPIAFDWKLNQWTDRAAIGMSRGGDSIFTDVTGIPLIVRDVDGHETTYPKPYEWTAVTGGYFSRNYRGGIGPKGVFFAVGWLASLGALCVWQPGTPDSPIWPLSYDQHDFNSDIIVRQSDGLMVVGTGVNQGETAQRVYVLDIPNLMFQSWTGVWMPLQPATAPGAEPVPAVNREVWCGWFEFAEPVSIGNAHLYVGPGGDGLCRDTKRQPICRYVAAASDSDLDMLERDIAHAKTLSPRVQTLCYWTYRAQQVRVPAGAERVGVEGYCHVAEPVSVFEARFIEAAKRARKTPWVQAVDGIAQCYTSNHGNTANLRGLVPVYARALRDRVIDGVWVFSGSGRPTGLQDQPLEVRQAWQDLANSIPGPPPIIVVPQPPIPVPIPPDPTPIPPNPQPEPEPPMPNAGNTLIFPNAGALTSPYEVKQIPHQDANLFPGLPIIGLEIVSGPNKGMIMQGQSQLGYRTPGDGIPGGGERFVDGGNMYIAVGGDQAGTGRWAYLKSQSYGS